MNPLLKIFLIFISGIAVLLAVYILFVPKPPPVDLSKVDFGTTTSSEMFFKNLRAYYYEKEEREDAGFTLYRINSRNLDSTTNKLNFVLLSNWRMSECYIMAESGIVKLEEEPLYLLDIQAKDTLHLMGKDAEANYLFAAQLYHCLINDHSLQLLKEKETISFKQSELTSLEKSLADYFKLVGR
jgi:hypothetical protein